MPFSGIFENQLYFEYWKYNVGFLHRLCTVVDFKAYISSRGEEGEEVVTVFIASAHQTKPLLRAREKSVNPKISSFEHKNSLCLISVYVTYDILPQYEYTTLSGGCLVNICI